METVILLLTLVISSALVARWASKKGRDFYTTFFIGLMFTPVFQAISLWREEA